MSIRDGATKFMLVIDTQLKRVVTRGAEELELSVKDGSPISGTKGMPFKTGAAHESVVPERIDDFHWKITATGKDEKGNDVGYVPHLEENIRGAVFSNGKQAHFFRDTVDAWPKIAEHIIAENNAQ